MLYKLNLQVAVLRLKPLKKNCELHFNELSF